MSSRSWNIKPSEVSIRTCNPIREVVDEMKIQPNPSKELINLSIGTSLLIFIGDPTIYGNFRVHSSIEEAIIKNLKNGKSNGYGPSTGIFLCF